MGKMDCARRWLVVLTFVTGLFSGCATIPELKLLYQLPPPTDRLKGQTVFLSIQDARGNKDIISEGAKEDFRGFTGDITLSVARSNEAGFRMGPFNFDALMWEGFRRRLETHGITVSREPLPSGPGPAAKGSSPVGPGGAPPRPGGDLPVAGKSRPAADSRQRSRAVVPGG